MNDAVGDQAPPFPIVDYSDQVVVGYVEGPLARTDPSGFDVLGTLALNAVFDSPPTPTLEVLPGTDCRDFSSISYWVYIVTDWGATQIDVYSYWSQEATPASDADFGPITSDDQIASGLSPQNTYIGRFTISGPTTLGPFNIPVRGRFARIGVASDNGWAEGYVKAMRLA
jgi:hypothetical protein